MDREKLIKMAGAVRTGGKGSMRRYCLNCQFTSINRMSRMISGQTFDVNDIFVSSAFLSYLLKPCDSPNADVNAR